MKFQRLLLCLPLLVLVSCQSPGQSRVSQRGRAGQPREIVPPVPTARELAQNPNWIPCDVKADWVYLENAPAGYKYADWVPLLPGSYEYPGSEWANRQPRRKFANGPGRLWLRKQDLNVGTMFQMDNDLLEITGDWRNGRLVRAERVRGAGELAARKLNWDAINLGLAAGAVGMSPFVWTGAKMIQAIKEGGSASSGNGGGGGEGQGHGETNSEEDRFKQHFKGRDVRFTVVSDNGGTALDGRILILRDSGTGKRFLFSYNIGFDTDLVDSGSMEGSEVEIRFRDNGEPNSIKNLSNGRGANVGSWSAKGYGW